MAVVWKGRFGYDDIFRHSEYPRESCDRPIRPMGEGAVLRASSRAGDHRRRHSRFL